MNKAVLEQIMLKQNPYKIPFDVGIIRPSNIASRYMEFYEYYSYGVKDLPSSIKSIVIYLFFTDTALDYYVKDIFTPRLVSVLNSYFRGITIYDDYKILRKEAAFLAGLGKIGRNSQLFSNKFGFNCKIDLVLTGIEFDYHENVNKDDYLLEYCQGCSVCVDSCPMHCSMNFDLKDWKKCDQFITPQTPTPAKMCRNCTANCKYSEDVCKETLGRELKRTTVRK